MAYSANLTAHDPNNYSTNASFVYNDANTAPILKLLNAHSGERILDLGCGNGSLTDRLVKLIGEQGEIWGTDANQKMLDAAAATYPGLASRLFQADAQDLQIPSRIEIAPNSFDAVFTNATLHWCKRSPRGVIQSVKKLLKTDRKGRFAGEFGGFQNGIGVRSQLHQVLRENGEKPEELDPWFFPTCEEYKELLESEGFTVEHISLTPRLTPLDTDLYGWLYTFARGSWLAEMSEAKAESIMREVVRRCEVDHRHSGKVGRPLTENSKNEWAVMYVRLRFSATLSE